MNLLACTIAGISVTFSLVKNFCQTILDKDVEEVAENEVSALTHLHNVVVLNTFDSDEEMIEDDDSNEDYAEELEVGAVAAASATKTGIEDGEDEIECMFATAPSEVTNLIADKHSK